MPYFERLIYEVVNTVTEIKFEKNPFRWSPLLIIIFTYRSFLFIVWMIMVPIYAYRLKYIKMPKSGDPEFKGSQSWYIQDVWVVKK